MPCIVNAANEVVNAAFREGRCGFLQMAEVIEKTMQKATFNPSPDYDVYIDSDREARLIAAEMI
jgi:1-deoxy-D-xylulose-5-phosphate reductoisomerase